MRKEYLTSNVNSTSGILFVKKRSCSIVGNAENVKFMYLWCQTFSGLKWGCGAGSWWNRTFCPWGGGSSKIWTFLSQIKGKLIMSNVKLAIFWAFLVKGGGAESLLAMAVSTIFFRYLVVPVFEAWQRKQLHLSMFINILSHNQINVIVMASPIKNWIWLIDQCYISSTIITAFYYISLIHNKWSP